MTVNCDDHKHFSLLPHQYHKCKKLVHFWLGVNEAHAHDLKLKFCDHKLINIQSNLL